MIDEFFLSIDSLIDIKLPLCIKSTHTGICISPIYTIFLLLQSLGYSQREYEKAVVNFSVKNQLRYKENLGK